MWRCVGLRRLRPSSNRSALLILARKAAPEEVFSFYQRAANAGSAPAQLWLGPAYLAGEKVAQDLALGRYWLALAAGNGSHEAEYQLSLQQSDAAAQAYWLMRAAEGGFSQAQFALAEWLQERGDLAAARLRFYRRRRRAMSMLTTPMVRCWGWAAKRIMRKLSSILDWLPTPIIDRPSIAWG